MISSGQSGFDTAATATGDPPAGRARSFWNDAYGPLPIETRARELGLTLIELENRLLVRLVRLQVVESRIWRMVARRRGLAARRALGQIEVERRRLGRELHTGIGQLLAAIRIQLEIVNRILPGPPAAVQQAFDRIGALTDQALAEVRALSKRLHPPEWTGLRLESALRQLWDMSGVAQRYTGSVRIDPPADDPEPEVKTLFYRSAQEALSNVMRHANAGRVDLMLTMREKRLVLTVEDDGAGFDTARVLAAEADVNAGMGLRSIREQAIGLGGKLLVHSGPGGTTLELSVPLR